MAQPFDVPFDFGHEEGDIAPTPARDPFAQEQIPWDFGTDTETFVTTTPSTKDAQFRAEKWHFGLGEGSPGTEVMYDRISTGQEGEEAKIQVQGAWYQEQQTRKQIIDDILENKQGNYTKDDIELIKNLSGTPLRDAADYFEAKYAEKVVNTASEAFLQRHKLEEVMYEQMDYVQRAIHLKEGVQKIVENLSADHRAKGWTANILPIAEAFVPLLFQARMRTGFFQDQGSALSQEYNRFFSMNNPSTALQEISTRANAIYENNPLAALQWLHGFAAYTGSDALLDNVWMGLDVLAVASSTYGLGKGLAAIAKGNRGRRMDPVVLLENTDIDKAIQLWTQRTLAAKADLTGAVSPHTSADPVEHLLQQTTAMHRGAFDQDKVRPNLVRESGQRVMDRIEYNIRGLEGQLASGPTKIARIEPGTAAMEASVNEADAAFSLKYPAIGVDNMIGVRTSNLDDAITSNLFRIYRLGEGADNVRQARGTVPSMFNRGPIVARGANRNTDEFAEATINRLDADRTIGPYDSEKRYALKRRMVDIDEASRPTVYDQRNIADTRYFNLNATNDNMTSTYGAPGPRPFKTEAGAERAAREEFGFFDGSYRIEPMGDGYVVEYVQALPETLPSVRNAMAFETKSTEPRNLTSLFRSWLPLSKDKKLSEDVMRSAKVVGYGTKEQQAYVYSLIEPIDVLRQSGKKAWNDFNLFLDRQRRYIKDGEHGRFSRDFPEFEKDWMKEFNRLPTEAEHVAYWSYVQLNDMDWVVNNLNIYRAKLRQGREMFSLPITNEGIRYTNMPSIEGRIVKNFPYDSRVPTVGWLWNENPKEVKSFTALRPGKMRDDITRQIESGELKVIQLTEYSDDQLRALGLDLPKSKPNYIITKDLTASPLSYQQIPYRPGGHQTYDYPWYIRMPKLRKHGEEGERQTTWYDGDWTFAGVNTEKEARAVHKRLETARQYFANGQIDDLRRYMDDMLPMFEGGADRFIRQFKGKGGNLDPNEKFYVTRSGKNVDNSHKLEDEFKSKNPNHQYLRSSDNPHNLNAGEIELRYASERNDPLHSFENVGTNRNPIYKYDKAKMIDPIAAAQRAANNITDARLLDDLKIKAVEKYFAEFSDLHDWSIDRIRSNPMDALMNSGIKDGANFPDVQAARSARRSTKELIGLRTDIQTNIDMYQQAVYEYLSTTPGIGGAVKWVGNHPMLNSTIKDPFKAMRSVAFNMTQGMYNPAAFVNQAQIVFNILAREIGDAGPVEGTARAVRSGISGQMMSYLVHMGDDVAKIKAFAKKQEAWGLSAKHFEEAFAGLKRSGFHVVGKETADWSTWNQTPIFKSKIGDHLDYAKVFFRKGEELGRYTAYVAAYDRWRKANPSAAFDSIAEAKVLERADSLNLRMSGISNSELQRGLPGVVTQFFTAHLRLAEQMWGKELSKAEKISVLAMNTAVYGLPVGMGALTGGLWPWKDTVKETMFEHGWHPSDHIATDLIVNGFAKVIMEQVGGGSYDFSQQGLGGVTLVRDFLRSQVRGVDDKSMASMLFGASGRSLTGIVESMNPLLGYALTTGNRKLTRQDFADILENAKGAGAVERIIGAYAYGKYFGKNEVRLEDVTAVQGIFTALTGLTPSSVADAYALLSSGKEMKEYQKKIEKKFALNVRRAWEAAENGDMESWQLFHDRANHEFIKGMYRPNQIAAMYRRALTDHSPLVERVFVKFPEVMNSVESLEMIQRQMQRRGN